MKSIVFSIVISMLIAGCAGVSIPTQAIMTPTITPKPTVTLLPTQTSDPAIILLDDFSNNTSGWWVDHTAYGTLYYANGKYRISGKKGDFITWSIFKGKPIVDAVYSVEYEFVSEDEENTGLDIYWRLRDNETYYFLQIWGNGTYAVDKTIDNITSEVVGIRKGKNLNPAPEPNKVTIVFYGDNAEIYFNNLYENSFSDSSIKYGDIGLGVFPSLESDVEVLFDNVAVYQYNINNPYTPIKPEPTATPIYKPITWDNLVQFLIDDHTNWQEYDLETYNCMDYAIDLVANARQQNLKAWIVGVYFIDQENGHAFVAFETSDRGIVYVEPQGDNTYSNVAVGNMLCDDWGQYECYGIVKEIEYVECDHDRFCSEFIP